VPARIIYRTKTFRANTGVLPYGTRIQKMQGYQMQGYGIKGKALPVESLTEIYALDKLNPSG
jgi:hypothetical protein